MGNKEKAEEAINNIIKMDEYNLNKRCELAYQQIKKFNSSYCFDLIKTMLSIKN